VSELVARYGVSRETFYVWKRRRESGEERWFEARSRAPGRCPHATGKRQVAAVVALRKRQPRFGAKKIRATLVEDRPAIAAELVAPQRISRSDRVAGLLDRASDHHL
jgi:putative transposase